MLDSGTNSSAPSAVAFLARAAQVSRSREDR